MTGQLDPLVDGLRAILGTDLVGVYLHGSSAIGGPKPTSDLDVLAVAARRTTPDEKRRLVDLLQNVSGRSAEPGPLRPIELDIVVQSEVRPWTYPPPFDFHYDELIRHRFEAGEREPWDSPTNVDLASIIRMALAGNKTIVGPPPADVFEPVPKRDFVDAVMRDLHTELEWLERDTRNVVLTLARIWTALETDDVHSKDTAAAWVLPRLPEQHRHVLDRARRQYLEGTHGPWEDIRPQVRAYIHHVSARLEALARSYQTSGKSR